MPPARPHTRVADGRLDGQMKRYMYSQVTNYTMSSLRPLGGQRFRNRPGRCWPKPVPTELSPERRPRCGISRQQPNTAIGVSYSNASSTILWVSRHAQIDHEVSQGAASGRDQLPDATLTVIKHGEMASSLAERKTVTMLTCRLLSLDEERPFGKRLAIIFLVISSALIINHKNVSSALQDSGRIWVVS